MIFRVIAGSLLVLNEKRDNRLIALGATLIGSALASYDRVGTSADV